MGNNKQGVELCKGCTPANQHQQHTGVSITYQPLQGEPKALNIVAQDPSAFLVLFGGLLALFFLRRKTKTVATLHDKPYEMARYETLNTGSNFLDSWVKSYPANKTPSKKYCSPLKLGAHE